MKKLSALIICFLIALTCILSGCAGFYVDRVKYYNEVVARVGEETITRFELLTAYNNFGKNNFSSQSKNEAINSTLDSLINSLALYQYAKNDEDDLYRPTGYQIKEIAVNIFDSLDGQVEDFIKTAKNVLNIEIEDEDADEQNTNVYKITDYQYKKRAELENGKIVYLTEKEPVFGDYEFGDYREYLDEKFVKDVYESGYSQKEIVEELKNKYLEHLKADLEKNEKENANAIENLVLEYLSKSLINYEYYLRNSNGKPYSKDTNGLLTRYFERTFNSYLQQQYITNYQEYYLSNENLSINTMISAYKEMVEYSEATYSNSISDYKSAMKNLSTNGDSILYHPNIDGDTQFGYFLHTLFQFSDAQKTELNKYKGKDDAKYMELVLDTEVAVRDPNSGLEIGTVKLKNVINSEQYKNLCNNPNANEFVNFMYKYTTDTATLASGMPYVVGSYNEENETFSANSAMEEAFTEECIKLMKTGTPNTMSVLNNDSAIEDFCITNYGVHIVFYVNPVYANDIKYSDRNRVYIEKENREDDPNGELNLYTKMVNPLTDKTYFDVMFDKVYPSSSGVYTSNTNYSKYIESIISQAKSIYKEVKYTDKIKATNTSL